jgi:GTP-binding protein
MRASGKDDAIALTPPTRLTLEESLEFLEDDELLEVTPNFLRLRKRHLKEVERRRAEKQAAALV